MQHKSQMNRPKTILLSGGSGLLGQSLMRCNNTFNLVAPKRAEMDVLDATSLERYFITCRPDIFVHAAAMTRPMAAHDENPYASIQINVVGTSNVASACIKHKVKLVFISTDYVYPGDVGNYLEGASLNPVNKYGWSKMAGECIVRLIDHSLILRACFTQRPFSHSSAFVDSYKSYLYVDQIAPLILTILESGVAGTLNVGGPRKSVFDFARESNPYVDPIERFSVGNWVPSDTSMNLEKLHSIIGKNNIR